VRSEVQIFPGPPFIRCIKLGLTVGLGALAQLGERVLCKHEVIGSIPIGSTIRAVTGAGVRERLASMRRNMKFLPGLPEWDLLYIVKRR
jgi:hypothetical protein